MTPFMDAGGFRERWRVRARALGGEVDRDRLVTRATPFAFPIDI